MTRRDFCHALALLSADAAAMPSQLAMFERFYDVNTRAFGEDATLINIKDICLGGLAVMSQPTIVAFYDGDRLLRLFAYNTFGGMIRWVSAPGAHMLARRDYFRWEITTELPDIDTANYINAVRGSITYLDMNLLQHTAIIGPGVNSLTGKYVPARSSHHQTIM